MVAGLWDAEDSGISLVHFSPCFTSQTPTLIITDAKSQDMEACLDSQEEADIRGS